MNGFDTIGRQFQCVCIRSICCYGVRFKTALYFELWQKLLVAMFAFSLQTIQLFLLIFSFHFRFDKRGHVLIDTQGQWQQQQHNHSMFICLFSSFLQFIPNDHYKIVRTLFDHFGWIQKRALKQCNVSSLSRCVSFARLWPDLCEPIDIKQPTRHIQYAQ